VAVAPYLFGILAVDRDYLAQMPASPPAAGGLHVRAKLIACAKPKTPYQARLNKAAVEPEDRGIAVEFTIADRPLPILM
jgi:hypothetical protein